MKGFFIMKKRILSLFMLIVMTITTLTATNLTAFGGYVEDAKRVSFNTSYTDYYSDSDTGYMINDNYSYKSYEFTIPSSGTVTIYQESSNREYFCYGLLLFSANDLDEEIWDGTLNKDVKYNSSKRVYYNSVDVSLKSGTYFLIKEYCNQFDYSGTYTIRFNYNITVSRPSALKVKTTGSTGFALYWSKVSGVSGYQLQQKSGSSYKTIADTKNTSFTVKNLKPATGYSFRVRSYKTVGGQKYYSSWTSLTAVTRPGTVSIKTPTTNTKHQITAKWSALSGASGYEVQFCRYKDFSSSVTTKSVSGKYTSYTFGRFTKGRVYYVRVRAYKTVNNARLYGSWSAVKSIKCK